LSFMKDKAYWLRIRRTLLRDMLGVLELWWGRGELEMNIMKSRNLWNGCLLFVIGVNM
jgi:hypothetical protein